MADEVLYSVSKAKSPIKEILLFIVFLLSMLVIYLFISAIIGSYGLLPLVLFILVSAYILFVYSRSSAFDYVNIFLMLMSGAAVILIFAGTAASLPLEYITFVFLVLIGTMIRSRFNPASLNTGPNEARLFVIIMVLGIFFLFISYFALNFTSLLGRPSFYAEGQEVAATLYDNRLTLDRRITFNLDSEKEYHEIFLPVKKESHHRYQIEEYECPAGSSFMVSEGEGYVEYICRSEAPYPPGRQAARFAYSVYNPYRKDRTKDLYSLNYMVSDSFDYPILRTSVSVRNELSNGQLLDYFTYPYGAADRGDIVIDWMNPNTPFSIRALISSPTYIGSYARSTISSFDFERVKINAMLDTVLFDLRVFVHIVMVFVMVFLVHSIYMRYGKDDNASFEPEALHALPNEDRKPWEANLLFVGTPGDMDSDAMHATLLDLESRGILSIRDDKRVVFRNIGRIDEYESLLLNIFEKYGDMTGPNEYLFDSEKVRSKLKSNFYLASSFSRNFKRLIDYPSLDSRKQSYGQALVESSFDVSGYDKAKGFVSCSILLALASMALFHSTHKVEFMVPFLAFLSALLLMVMAFGDLLFGKFRLGLIDERKKWAAFSSLLSDYGLIRKCGKDGMIEWKNWFEYAVALGIADKAISQMKGLNPSSASIAGKYSRSLARARLFARTALYEVNTYASGLISRQSGGKR